MTGKPGRLLIAAVVWLAVAAPTPVSAEIRWYTSLTEASAAALKADLPMFIDFWADWCAPCKIMDAEVYPDPKVIAAFEEKAIGVRLHYDLQPDMVRRYNVPAIPYMLFTTSKGTPLIYIRGLLEADDLVKALEAIPPLSTINGLDRRLLSNKSDFASLLAMGKELRAAGFYESSNEFYDRAAKHRAARSDAGARESIVHDTALNWLVLQNGKRAAEILEKGLKALPTSVRKPDLLVALGRAYALDEKPARARQVLSSVIKEFPDSAAAAEAAALLESM